ncbi:MFS transporter [bacterium]|nr:MFS transporter [bacterium]
MNKTEIPASNGKSVLALFKLSAFKWIFASNSAFFFAMNSQNIVRSWLAFKLMNSELALGLIMFTIAVPMFFLSPIGGVITDRRDRRNVILFGQITIFAADLLVFLMLYFDVLEFWHLLVTSAISGCMFPLIMPARNAIVVNIVGKSRLEQAMAVNIAGINTMRVLGPAFAGFLIDLTGETNAYLVSVILYGLAAFCMTRIAASPPTDEMKNLSVKKSIVEGFTYVWEHRLILILLSFGLLPMFLAMPFQNLLVVFAEKIWDVGSRGFGFLGAAMGMGGIFGAAIVAFHTTTKTRLRRMMISMLGFGVFLFCFAFSPWFGLGLVLVFIANAFISTFNTLNNTAIQLLIPDHVRGRISSFLMMSFSLPLLGSLPVAAVAEIYGAPVAVAGSSILSVIIGLLFYGLSQRLRNMDDGIKTAMADEQREHILKHKPPSEPPGPELADGHQKVTTIQPETVRNS